MDYISISRHRSTDNSEGVEVQIVTKNKLIYRGDMTLEDYARLVTNQGHVPINRSLPEDNNEPDVEEEAYHEWLNTPDHGQD